jgi:hypothetical protein
MTLSDNRVLADFEGHWTVTRDITQDTGPNAQFTGQAVWIPIAQGLAYRETGVLTLEGQAPMQSERRYHWAPDLSVYFDDGRFFHKVPPMGGKTGHWCDPDQYDVHYSFDAWPQFQLDWRVTGPRKAYCMRSIYSRP